MSINSVCISGNLTRDPELRRTASGTSVMNFSVAVNESRKNQQTGDWEEYPSYIDCTMFGRGAESLSDIMCKGMKVCVAGKLRQNRWEKDGQARSKVEVVANTVELPPKGSSKSKADPVEDYYETDLPF